MVTERPVFKLEGEHFILNVWEVIFLEDPLSIGL